MIFGDIRVLIDNGTGKSRKVIDITSSTVPNIPKQALIGLHAFSGNDYVSSFFRKGKFAFWKAMLKAMLKSSLNYLLNWESLLTYRVPVR